MSSTLRTVVGLSLLFFTLGCGSGGGNKAPTGKVCPEVYDPLPVDLNPANDPAKPMKLEFGAGANGITQFPGDYTYVNAELYYTNTKTGVRMHFADTLNPREKQHKLGLVCVAGLKPNSEGFMINTTAVSKMEVLSTKLASFGVRNFIVQFSNTTFPQRKAEDGDSSKFEAPSKVYEGKASQYFLYKAAGDNTTDFESRSRHQEGDEQLDVVVRYKRK